MKITELVTKPLVFITLFILIQDAKSQVNEPTLISFKTKNCPTDLLYGEWLLIKMYPERLTQPDTLNAVPKNSRFGTPFMIFEKNGRYKSDEGDYSEDGNYTLDSNNCMISFSPGKLKLEITYIDDSYLLLVKNDKPGHRTFFYTRKVK